MNILSNIAYLVAAFAVDDVAVSISLVILALGSALFHYDEKYEPLDHFGMVAVLATTVLGPASWHGYLIVAAGCAYVAHRGRATPTMAALGAVAVAMLPLGRAVISIAIFALAYWIWQKDDNLWWSDGPAFHSIWHALTAIFLVTIQG